MEGDEVADGSDDGEEEVFALKGMAESSDEAYEDEEVEVGQDDGDTKDTADMASRRTKSKQKNLSKRPPQSSSEDEEDEEEEEEESWGRKKSVFYSSNAAQLDSDDEEGHEMEEQEAIRLQAKLREPLQDDDFGFTEAMQVSFDSEDAE